MKEPHVLWQIVPSFRSGKFTLLKSACETAVVVVASLTLNLLGSSVFKKINMITLHKGHDCSANSLLSDPRQVVVVMLDQGSLVLTGILTCLMHLVRREKYGPTFQ